MEERQGVDGLEGLEAEVGSLLQARGATLAVAESCTGGLLAERLTRVAGSSIYFLGGIVAYHDRVKSAFLGVSEELLHRYGAVSEPVARAMANGVRTALGSDYGIAITGVAGPSGGSEEKPVGTVYLAGEGPDGERERRLLRLAGDRRDVRRQATEEALEMLRRLVLSGVRAR